EGHSHENGFVVVGILAPTGTPNDRAVFVNMEGFFLMSNHAKPLKEEKETEGEAESKQPAAKDATATKADAVAHDEHEPMHLEQRQMHALPLEQRDLTAFLLRTVNPFVAAGLQRSINKEAKAQCVQPVKEIYELL